MSDTDDERWDQILINGLRERGHVLLASEIEEHLLQGQEGEDGATRPYSKPERLEEALAFLFRAYVQPIEIMGKAIELSNALDLSGIGRSGSETQDALQRLLTEQEAEDAQSLRQALLAFAEISRDSRPQ